MRSASARSPAVNGSNSDGSAAATSSAGRAPGLRSGAVRATASTFLGADLSTFLPLPGADLLAFFALFALEPALLVVGMARTIHRLVSGGAVAALELLARSAVA